MYKFYLDHADFRAEPLLRARNRPLGIFFFCTILDKNVRKGQYATELVATRSLLSLSQISQMKFQLHVQFYIYIYWKRFVVNRDYLRSDPSTMA